MRATSFLTTALMIAGLASEMESQELRSSLGHSATYLYSQAPDSTEKGNVCAPDNQIGGPRVQKILGSTCESESSVSRYIGINCNIQSDDYKGKDHVYSMVLANDNRVGFSLTSSVDFVLVLMSKCGDERSCIANSPDFIGGDTEVIPAVPRPAGRYYLYVDSADEAACGEYELTIDGPGILPQSDIELTRLGSVDPVMAGLGPGNLTYEITVRNDGPSDATGLVLSEELLLPDGVHVDSTTASFGSFRDSTWTLDSLPNGASETLTVVLTVDSSTASGTDLICGTTVVTALNEINIGDTEIAGCTSVANSVDLVLTKTESADPVVAGSGGRNLTHVLTVSNNGPSDATGLVLNEELMLPAGLSPVSIRQSRGTYRSGIWTLGSLPSGSRETLTVSYTVDPTTASGTDLICGRTTVRSLNEPNTGNSQLTECTSVARRVDLELTHTESMDPVVAGSGTGNLTYEITVENKGPSNANGLILRREFILAEGVVLDSITPSRGDFDGFTWSLGSLLQGASETLTIVLTADSSIAAGTDAICNVLTVAALSEPNVGDTEVSECTSVGRKINLEVVKSDSAARVVAGSGPGNLTYQVTVRNRGPSDATGLVLDEELILPTGVSVDSMTTNRGNIEGSTWNLGALPRGTRGMLTVVLTVDSSTPSGPGMICSTASVTASNEPNVGDSEANECTSVDRRVNLQLSQTVSAHSVLAGSGPNNLTYEVVVRNNGPSDASELALSEQLTLPEGVIIESIIPTRGSFEEEDSLWTLNHLAAGSSERLTVVLTVSASTFPGTICSTAMVIDVNESNVGNTDVAECTPVEREVDLELSTTESTDPVVAGSALTYMLTVKNNGPSDASELTLHDELILPPGVTIDSIDPSGGIFSESTWELDSLASGDSEMLTIVLAVDGSVDSGMDVIRHIAEVTALNEFNLGDTESMERTSVGRQVDLELSLTESTNLVVAPGRLTYELIVKNNGPSDASDLTLLEMLHLPEGVNVDSTRASGGLFADPYWILSTLSAGAHETLTISFEIDSSTAAGRNVIGATATVWALNELNLGDSEVTEYTSVGRQADLELTRTESADPAVVNGNFTYVVTVKNNGPSDATGLTVLEELNLPEMGVIISSITPSAGAISVTPIAGTTITNTTWTLDTLPIDASETLTIVLDIAPEAVPGTDVICATATVVMLNEPYSGDSSASACTSISRDVELSLSMTKPSNPVTAVMTGSDPVTLTYELTVANGGPFTATGLMLNVELNVPDGVSAAPPMPSRGSFVDSVWTLDDLPIDDTGETLKMDMLVTSGATLGTDVICVTATVSDLSELNTGVRRLRECTTIFGVDLNLTMAYAPDPVRVSTSPVVLTYELTVSNSSPFDANGLQVSDEVLRHPEGVAMGPSTVSAGVFEDSTWELGPLESGASATLTVSLTIPPDTEPGENVICREASVIAVVEPDIGDRMVSECTSIIQDVNLSLTMIKPDRVNAVMAGSNPVELTYELEVANDGPFTATDLMLNVESNVPVGVDDTPPVPSRGSFVDSVWTLNELPIDDTGATLMMNLTVNPGATLGTDVICVKATVSDLNEYNTGDPDILQGCTTIFGVDLNLMMTFSLDPVEVGTSPVTLTYELTVSNNSPFDATGLELSEVLTHPPGVTIDDLKVSAGVFTDPIWTLGTLKSGASATLTVKLTIPPDTEPGEEAICSRATVTAVEEPDVGNGMMRKCISIVAPTQTRSCIDPAIGLTAWWPFDDASAPIALDIARSNDGWHFNGPTPSNSKVDLALSFDGVDDYVEIPHDATLDMGSSPSGDFSIAFWIKTEESLKPDNQVMTLIDKRKSGNATADTSIGYHLFLLEGRLGLQLSDNDRSLTPVSFSNYTNPAAFVADGEWHFVMVTVDRDDPNGGRWYVDGEEIGLALDPTLHPGSLENAAPLRIGRRSFDDESSPSDPGGHFAGLLDELQIFNRVLTPEEMRSIYQAGSLGQCKESVYVRRHTPICSGASAGTGEVAICNHATHERNYTVAFSRPPRDGLRRGRRRADGIRDPFSGDSKHRRSSSQLQTRSSEYRPTRRHDG